jgi:hypothetical protein
MRPKRQAKAAIRICLVRLGWRLNDSAMDYSIASGLDVAILF